MKKKEMAAFINSQAEIIGKYKKIIDQNDRTMRIQDNAIIRKDEEVEICNNAAKALKKILEETREALSRSRNFVKIIQSNKSRSIEDMAMSLYEFYGTRATVVPWEKRSLNEKEIWMGHLVEILSGEKINKG